MKKSWLGLVIILGVSVASFEAHGSMGIPSKKQKNPGVTQNLAGKAAVNKVAKRVAGRALVNKTSKKFV